MIGSAPTSAVSVLFQRLVAVARQEQPGEVLAEASALDVGVEEIVEGVGILLEWRGDPGLAWCDHEPPPFALPLSYHML